MTQTYLNLMCRFLLEGCIISLLIFHIVDSTFYAVALLQWFSVIVVCKFWNMFVSLSYLFSIARSNLVTLNLVTFTG